MGSQEAAEIRLTTGDRLKLALSPHDRLMARDLFCLDDAKDSASAFGLTQRNRAGFSRG